MKKLINDWLNIFLSSLLVVLIFIIDALTPAGYMAAPLYTNPPGYLLQCT